MLQAWRATVELQLAVTESGGVGFADWGKDGGSEDNEGKEEPS